MVKDSDNLYHIFENELKNAVLINNNINRFICFDDMETLKFNEYMNRYDIPLSFVAYPVDYVLSITDKNHNKIKNNDIKLKEKIYIFSVKSDILDIDQINQKQYKLYINKIFFILKNIIKSHTIKNTTYFPSFLMFYKKNPKFSILKYLIYPNTNIRNINYELTKKFLKSGALNNIILYLEQNNIIKKNGIKNIDHLLYVLFEETIKGKNDFSHIITKIILLVAEYLSLRLTLKKTFGERFWFITSGIAGLISSLKLEPNIFKLYVYNNYSIRKRTIVWHKLLLKLNINMIVDNGDTITKNNPIALLLRKNIINNINIIKNKKFLN